MNNKNLILKVFTRRLFTKNRRVLALAVIAAISATIFLGCSSSGVSVSQKEETISVVTTIFPEYDWVKQIVGDNENVEITLLLDNGVDLHSFQPTADDILKIADCDLFIYVGGESDEWVEDALSEATNENMRVINLLDTLGDSAKEEEIVEGMEAEEEGEEEEEGPEYDEHVWLSLKNAKTLVSVISDALSSIDEENADTYKSNTAAYMVQLEELDGKYQDVVDNASVNTLLFGDRFPFRYLVDDYGIDYYAAFVGCSAETEASFETVKFLSDKLNDLDLKSVLTIENSDQKIAQTIIDNSGSSDIHILAMDSMQSTTITDVEAGTSYLSIMESNLEVLEQALN